MMQTSPPLTGTEMASFSVCSRVVWLFIAEPLGIESIQVFNVRDAQFVPSASRIRPHAWARSERTLVMLEISGVGGLIILILDIWALVSIVGSNRGTGSKVLWILLVLILPVLGFIIWLIAGPRSRR
jgi:hypothetical protein